MQSQFVVSTDKQEKIKLESGIIEASLISPVAYGGLEVQFEVKTVFVAEGSAIEVKGRSSKGKAPDTVKGKIFNNTFRGSFLIPEKVSPDAEIWFEAKLPKHGLKMDSNAIPARPSIGVKKMCWDREKIVRNELVKLTCQFTDGVQDGDEAVFIIYEHNPNSCDIKVVSIPATVKGNTAEVVWEFTYKGNTADIPTQAELQKVNKSYVNPQYYFIVSVKGQQAGKNRESGLLKFRDTAEFRVFASGETSLPDKTVTFTFADGSNKDGTTDKFGIAKVIDIPPGPCFVKVKDVEDSSQSSGDTANTPPAEAAPPDSGSTEPVKIGQLLEELSGDETDAEKEIELIKNDGNLVPFFYQLDENWKNDILGKGRTIGQAGCCVCCIAMILKYYGRDVTPKTLDAYLDKNSGYSGDAVYIDVALKYEESAEIKLKSSRVSSGFASILDEQIKNNIPTIARVKYGSSKSASGDHFVVVVGKNKDGKYIMNDPGASNGSGSDNPSSENIIEETKRKSGYTIVRLDYILVNA